MAPHCCHIAARVQISVMVDLKGRGQADYVQVRGDGSERRQAGASPQGRLSIMRCLAVTC